MTYRLVTDGFNIIRVKTSSDGSNWSFGHEAFREPDHSAVSPTVEPAHNGHPAMTWYVAAGPQGCTTTSSRVMVRQALGTDTSLDATTWGPSQPTDLVQPGYVIWHMKVRYIPSRAEYVALYVAFPADGGTCSNDDMFIARSADGVHWQSYSRPVLRHERRVWTAGALYRGSFIYDAATDYLHVWFSAADVSSNWRIGYARFNFSTLLKQLALPARAQVQLDLSDAPPVRTTRIRWKSAP